jgi:hypothetical protein
MANVFIHIPKTAGSSLMTGLKGANIISVGHNLRDANYRHPSQVCAKDDYIFTFVRNPYTRVLSSYFYLLNGGNCPEDAYDAYLLGIRTMDLNKFIEKRLDQAAQWQIHFIPQSFFLHEVIKPDIFRFEELPKGFDELCMKFKLSNRQLPHFNISKPKPAKQTSLTNKAISVIKRVYAEDFKRFAYSKTPMTSLLPGRPDQTGKTA